MKQKIFFHFLLLATVVLAGACNNTKTSKSNDNNPDPEVLVQENISPDLTGVQVENMGEYTYKKYCLKCHQRDAEGIPKRYPPLANNKTVSGDKKELIKIVLNGMKGEITVNGQIYNGVMAGYSALSDDEIADVLNYLRQDFGNKGEKITPEEVKALR